MDRATKNVQSLRNDGKHNNAVHKKQKMYFSVMYKTENCLNEFYVKYETECFVFFFVIIRKSEIENAANVTFCSRLLQ